MSIRVLCAIEVSSTIDVWTFLPLSRGMTSKSPITDLINQWKPRAMLAAEVGQEVAAVHKWASSNRIPAQHQAAVVAAAQKRGITYVTPEWMLNVHAAVQDGDGAA
jgi:hypothetical protein